MPFLGESLAIARNMHGFLLQRASRHGSIFKSNVFGRNVVFLSGPDGATTFLDTSKVDRAGGHPPHVRELFGGTNINMYNGPKHGALKSLMLKAFNREAFAVYLPSIERLTAASLARAAAAGEVPWTNELRKLAIECICLNVLGLEPGEQTDRIRADYATVLRGMTSIPIPLPMTAYTKAKAARDRLLRFFEATVVERRNKPGTDGLSRILQAQMPDGTAFTNSEAVLEVHHIIIAGYIVFGILMSLGIHLRQLPDVAARARAEVITVCGKGPLELSALMRLPYLLQVVLEAKRHAPILPLVFGTARENFSFGGYHVPKGWGVYWALTASNFDPSVFRSPEVFDPDRFGPERAEHQKHEHAFVPQGSGPETGHKCLGADYSTVLALAFAAVLLRDYEWSFPEQDMNLRWDLTPVEPADGLRVRLQKRGSSPSTIAGAS